MVTILSVFFAKSRKRLADCRWAIPMLMHRDRFPVSELPARVAGNFSWAGACHLVPPHAVN